LRTRNIAIAVLCVGVCAAVLGGIQPNQSDDFENGTAQGWSHGPLSPNPPTNVADGGPLGAGDNFLQNVSSGVFGSGGRMVMFNVFQWSGDYLASNIGQIEFDARNLGNTSLHLRVAFEGGIGTRWSSTNAVTLPAQGPWTPVVFEVSEAAMTRVGGVQTFDVAFAAVGQLRILSFQGGPSWMGQLVAATLGVDNITTSLVPVELQQFTVE